MGSPDVPIVAHRICRAAAKLKLPHITGKHYAKLYGNSDHNIQPLEMKITTQDWNKMRRERPPTNSCASYRSILRIAPAEHNARHGTSFRSIAREAISHGWQSVTREPMIQTCWLFRTAIAFHYCGTYVDDGVERGFRWLEKKIRGVWRLEKLYSALRHPLQVLEKVSRTGEFSPS